MSKTRIRTTIALLVTMLLFGCASKESALLPPKLDLPPKAAPEQGAGTVEEEGPAKTKIEEMPTAPQSALDQSTKAVPKPVMVARKDTMNLNFEQVPLTTLIQVVYSEILGRPVSIDPKVMERRDLVTFRTPEKQTASQIASAMQLLLKSYGLAAMDVGDLVRVVPDNAQGGNLPELRRGAALPETPEVLRPIFQLVELKAVRNTDVAGWIKNMFGERINMQEDATRNAVLLSGTSDNVAAVIETLRVLDQPLMRGRSSLRITPTFMAAEELGKRLHEILAAEGYTMPADSRATLGGGMRYPILLLPLAESNSLLVFTMSDEILAHIQDWVTKLDQPNEQMRGPRSFTYTAQNTSAETLAVTLTQVFLGSADAAAKASKGQGQVVVNKASNTLIFQSEAAEYPQILSLLRTLDKPAKSALIEVTVADVTLTEESQLGIEWLLKDAGTGGANVDASTLSGELPGAGFNLSAISAAGNAKILLNALATSNRANILSSPRIMARSGETATIQVGDEVPVITSQQSTLNSTTPNDPGVLQTVQYRSTGVILTVKPVIHSGNRVDLEIQQEVSAAATTKTGVNASPTISTRKVQTNMTLINGETVLLGGLIKKDNSSGDSGIPGLKDIPLLGALFRSETQKYIKTEMIVLITPYILDTDSDARAVTKAFKEILPSLHASDDDTCKLPPPPAVKDEPIESEPLETP